MTMSHVERDMEGYTPCSPRAHQTLKGWPYECKTVSNSRWILFGSKDRQSVRSLLSSLISGGSGLGDRMSRESNRFEDGAVVFYENIDYIFPVITICPCMCIRDVELKRAIIDPRSSLNIISLCVLEVARTPRDRITRQPIECHFGGNCIYTLSFVNLDLTSGLMRAAHRFHVIDSPTVYHLLLEMPWIHHHKVNPHFKKMRPSFRSCLV